MDEAEQNVSSEDQMSDVAEEAMEQENLQSGSEQMDELIEADAPAEEQTAAEPAQEEENGESIAR